MISLELFYMNQNMKKIIVFSILILTFLLSIFLVEDVKAISLEDYNSPYLDVEWFGSDMTYNDWLTNGSTDNEYDNIINRLGLDSENTQTVLITPYIISVVEHVVDPNPNRYVTYYYLYDTILIELDGDELIITFGKEAMETLYSSVKSYYEVNSVVLGENEGFSLYLNPHEQVETNYQEDQGLYYEGIYFSTYSTDFIINNICQLFNRTESVYLSDVYNYENGISNVDIYIRPRLIDYPTLYYYDNIRKTYLNSINDLTMQLNAKDSQIQQLQNNITQMTDLSDGTFFSNLFGSLTTLFNTKIIGNITLGVFIFVPLLILVLGVILKVARG